MAEEDGVDLSSVPILDTDRLELGDNDCMDPDFAELLRPFFEDTMESPDSFTTLCHDLEQQLAAGNIEATKRAAHTMRGVASTAGCARMAAAIQDLERQLPEPPPSCIADFRALMVECRKAFDRFSSLPPTAV